MLLQQAEGPFQCPICYPKDEEVVHLMYNLRNLILKKFQKINDSQFPKPQSIEDKHQGAIEKLIRFIFNEKIPAGFSCRHSIVEQFLVLKTKLPHRQLNFICDSIYQFSAKRNYQIEVLTSQIKCFPKSIVEEIAKKTKQTQTKPNVQRSNVKVESPTTSSAQLKDSQELLSQCLGVMNSGMNMPCVYYPYYFQTVPQPFHGFYNQAM